MLSKHFWLINLLIFDALWLCAALLKDQAMPYMVALLLVHIVLSPSRLVDGLVVFAVGLLGCLIESLLVLNDWLVFDSAVQPLPIWMMLLWAGFALSLNHALRCCARLPLWQQALLGAVMGSISYYLASNMGALRLSAGELSLVVIAVIWAVLFPALVLLARIIRVSTRHEYHYL